MADAIALNGISTWLAFRDIRAGENFAQAIIQAIETSTHILVLVTEDSITSQHVMREVNHAIDQKKILIPVFRELSAHTQKSLPDEWRYWLGIAQAISWPVGANAAKVVLPHITSGPMHAEPLGARSSTRSEASKRLTPTSLEVVFAIPSEEYFDEVISYTVKYPDRPVVVYFCNPQQQLMRSDLEYMARKAQDRWVLGVVDITLVPSLAARYGAKFPPNLFVVKSGEVKQIARMNYNKKGLQELLAKHL
jgi:thioredoxin-like negative regulator of GroEL